MILLPGIILEIGLWLAVATVAAATVFLLVTVAREWRDGRLW